MQGSTQPGSSAPQCTPAATAPAQVVPANNWAIELARTQPRIIPFGTIHPGFADFEPELDRLERAGIKGIKIHADFQGFRLDDPALFPVLEAMRGRFVALFHVGDRLPPDKNPSCPAKLAAIHRDFARAHHRGRASGRIPALGRGPGTPGGP